MNKEKESEEEEEEAPKYKKYGSGQAGKKGHDEKVDVVFFRIIIRQIILVGFSCLFVSFEIKKNEHSIATLNKCQIACE